MIDPAEFRTVMANIATVFHWPPSELKRLRLSELRAYHQLALERAG